MAQVSHADSDFSSGDQNIEANNIITPVSTEESKRKTLIRKVREKAKGTVRKIKDKVKKGSHGGQTDSDDEWEGSEPQSESKEDAHTVVSAESKDMLSGDHDGSEEVYKGKYQEDLLSSFARSDQSKNSPLVAVPTDYSDPRATVDDSIDAVMPPIVIQPTSVSELGEQSSSSLGEIPEAKEEEKAAVAEIQSGGPDSDGGFKKTFNQKDLEAIDGLPKPRGFDTNNESSVRSSDGNYLDGEGDTREFPDAQVRGIKEDNERPHPSASPAELHDSMFSSSASQDIVPNKPAAGQLNPGSVTGTLSRGVERGAKGLEDDEGPHPRASDADLQESMFSSAAGQGLAPNEPSARHANPESGPVTSSRGVEETNQLSGTDESKGQHPPSEKVQLHDNMLFSTVASDLKPSPTDGQKQLTSSLSSENKRDFNGSSSPVEGREDREKTTSGTRPECHEQEEEEFYDAKSDEALSAGQRSLDSQSCLNPEAGVHYDVQKTSSTASAEAASTDSERGKVSNERTAGNDGAKGDGTQSSSSLASALASIVDSVGSRVGYYTFSSDLEPPVGEQPSASVADTQEDPKATDSGLYKVSGLISKAIGAVTGAQDEGTTKTDPDDELPPFSQ